MMKLDAAIETVRDARKRISADVGNDPAKLVAHYVEYQKQFGDRVLDGSSVRAAEAAIEPAEQGRNVERP